MKFCSVKTLREIAKVRGQAYLDDCLRTGRLEGGVVYWDEEPFAALQAKWKEVDQREGWGDRLHRFFGPIGRVIHWPCMKGDGSTDLIPGSPCDQNRKILNKIR